LAGPHGGVAYARKSEEADADAAAAAALQRVTSKLKEAESVLTAMAEHLRSADSNPLQLRDAEQVLGQIKPVETTLDRMLKRRRGQDPGDAFTVVARMSALVSDAERDRTAELDDGPPGPPPPDPPPGWLRRCWNAVLAHFKEAMLHLWAFIANLVTPTQWTVQGNVGTGVFGFASASVSVTFGKSD